MAAIGSISFLRALGIRFAVVSNAKNNKQFVEFVHTHRKVLEIAQIVNTGVAEGELDILILAHWDLRACMKWSCAASDPATCDSRELVEEEIERRGELIFIGFVCW